MTTRPDEAPFELRRTPIGIAILPLPAVGLSRAGTRRNEAAADTASFEPDRDQRVELGLGSPDRFDVVRLGHDDITMDALEDGERPAWTLSARTIGDELARSPAPLSPSTDADELATLPRGPLELVRVESLKRAGGCELLLHTRLDSRHTFLLLVAGSSGRILGSRVVLDALFDTSGSAFLHREPPMDEILLGGISRRSEQEEPRPVVLTFGPDLDLRQCRWLPLRLRAEAAGSKPPTVSKLAFVESERHGQLLEVATDELAHYFLRIRGREVTDRIAAVFYGDALRSAPVHPRWLNDVDAATRWQSLLESTGEDEVLRRLQADLRSEEFYGAADPGRLPRNEEPIRISPSGERIDVLVAGDVTRFEPFRVAGDPVWWVALTTRKDASGAGAERLIALRSDGTGERAVWEAPASSPEVSGLGADPHPHQLSPSLVQFLPAEDFDRVLVGTTSGGGHSVAAVLEVRLVEGEGAQWRSILHFWNPGSLHGARLLRNDQIVLTACHNPSTPDGLDVYSEAVFCLELPAHEPIEGTAPRLVGSLPSDGHGYLWYSCIPPLRDPPGTVRDIALHADGDGMSWSMIPPGCEHRVIFHLNADGTLLEIDHDPLLASDYEDTRTDDDPGFEEWLRGLHRNFQRVAPEGR